MHPGNQEDMPPPLKQETGQLQEPSCLGYSDFELSVGHESEHVQQAIYGLG